jgi:UDP-GlcNAc:undecaprenyl-phosphate GlcNAc-1-phosphate transferase
MFGSLNNLVFHNDLALRFFPALLFSLCLTPITIRFSNRLNAVDYPGEWKIHSKPLTRLGGVAVAVGVVVTLLFFEKMDRTLAAFLSGALLVVLTGFLDDIYHIPPAAKFLGEVLGAGVFILLSGIWITDFGNLFGFGVIRAGILAPVITVFYGRVMNALNLSDGLDGLAGDQRHRVRVPRRSPTLTTSGCHCMCSWRCWGHYWDSCGITPTLRTSLWGTRGACC